MRVLKRDKTVEKFSKMKIRKSLQKTFKSSRIKFCPECYDEIIKNITDAYSNEESDILDIEKIQDITETTLVKCDLPEVAKEYILYRHERDRIREFARQKQNFIESYKTAYNTADNTIDDNSNVANKNIGVLNAEIHKKDNIQINRMTVTNKIHELYPDFDAKQYCRDLEDHIIYKNDESSFACISPYCVAITMYPFLINGMKDLGGLSAKPKNLDSYCGMLVNLVFALSSQFAGACMYKDQELLINKDGLTHRYAIKDFVSKFELNNTFNNYQGDWEYADISDLNYFVEEDGKTVKINKVYRRKYTDDIYRIKTHTGLECCVSKDHIFKSLFRGRLLELKANELQKYETVFISSDHLCMIDKASQDYKDGQFLGIICGDGCLTDKNCVRVSINTKQMFIKDFLDEYFEKKYNKKGTFTLDKRGRSCGEYRICSIDIRNDICKSLIPCEIYNTFTKNVNLQGRSIDFQLGFMDGLLVTDGCYSIDKGFKLSLTNKGLIETAIQILKNININDVHYTGGKVYGESKNKHPMFNVWIPSKTKKYLDLTLLKPCKSSLVRASNRFDVQQKRMGNEVYYLGPKHSETVHGRKFITQGATHNMLYKLYHTDVIECIETFRNDDDYVYEIETETHWYNCGGFITHNCALPEALLCFDFFARKEWGDDYIDHIDEPCKSGFCATQRSVGEQIHQYFQQIIYSINQPASARGMQSAFVNFSYFDEPFFHGMFDDFVFPDGTRPIWRTLNWLQKDFMQWFNAERLKCVLTFPVESFAMIYQDGEFVDKDNFQFVCNEYARGHSFFTYISDTVDSLSSCCRLRNNLTTREFNFTNGNLSVQTGSKSVISLNLSRIVQNAVKDFDNPQDRLEKDAIYEAIKKYLIDVLDRVYIYHNAYNQLLWDMYEAKLMPAYDAGFINLDKQYLTIGLNGLNQAAEFLGLKCTKNKQYGEFCHMIFGTVKEQNALHKTKHTMFNTEQVPAESLAVKNYNWDKEDGYWTPDDTNLYASYIFKPNDPKISVLDKIEMHGRDYIGEYLDGGSAAHINLSEHLSSKQYDVLLHHAAKTGCQYLTFNIPNSECEDCGWIGKTPVDECPKCHSKNIVYWDRIIGYLTKIRNWSEGRRIEQKTRVYTKKENV